MSVCHLHLQIPVERSELRISQSFNDKTSNIKSDALRSEMIIPRTPSPEAPDEGLDGLSLDEIRRLARERLAEVKVSFPPS